MNLFYKITILVFVLALASFGGANETNQSDRMAAQHLSTSLPLSTISFINFNQYFRDSENSESSIVSRLSVDNGQDERMTFVDSSLPRGGGIASFIPAGYHPFGYKITELGTQFLEFEGSLDSDIGRFLASVKKRKQLAELKAQWLEIVRVAKSAQSMRIYRTMDELIAFCIKARLLD